MAYSAGGRWVPGPGVSYAPLPPQTRPHGVWGDITLKGDSTAELGGHSYPLPILADAKVVSAGRISFLHVLHQGRVYVFAQGKQLQESDDEAKARAVPAKWAELGRL